MVIKHSGSQAKKLEEKILAVAYGYRGGKENKNGENPEKGVHLLSTLTWKGTALI